MASEAILAFNRGLVSRLGLARSDVERLALSAETMTNWIPRVLGSMSIRPGTEYLGATKSNLAAKLVPFKFSVSDTAILEFTTGIMRIWDSDALLTRASVSSAVTNGTFTQYTDVGVTFTNATNVVNYTDTDDIWTNGDEVTFTTTDTLPAELTAGTTYYVVNLDVGINVFKVAATSGGSAIALSDDGTGTHTAAAYDYIASWTDNDESSTQSNWVTGTALELTGNDTNAAIRDQTITVAAGDQSVVHALDISIVNGPVVLRVGTSTSDDSYINEVELETGYHNLAFTPTGNFNIRFQNRLARAVVVASCEVSASGTVEVISPILAADLDNIRYDQSGDIVFIAVSGQRPVLVKRRDNNSWSVVNYYSPDGPWRVINTGPITITPSALTGNITLTASAALFRSTNATNGGSLYQITSSGQNVVQNIAADATTYSDAIKITGIDSARVFTIVIEGVTASTITLQRSLTASTGPWETASTFTAVTTETYDDALDNQIVYYRIGMTVGDYGGADNMDLTLNYDLGSITGVARVTAFTSSIVVSAEVLVDLGDNVATDLWTEGAWSDRRGWPKAVAFHEGRLWWAGLGSLWGSVSDSFTSYDDTVEGDTGPIDRQIATGGTDTINWLVSGQRLLVGAQTREFTGKSGAFDDPVTPTKFYLTPVGTQGSGAVSAVKIDNDAIFVGRTETKIYEMTVKTTQYYAGMDYGSEDLTKLVPDLGRPQITRLAVQRQPDTRIHAVRSDGKVILGLFDRTEEVLCWSLIETDGSIEDVVVFPATAGEADDQVYYVVNRTINSSTVRYLEKMAQQEDCLGGDPSYLADSYISGTVAGTAVSGLTHLEGENVVVWADGADVGTTSARAQTYTVASGAITLADTYTTVIVGMPYSAQWKSSKLGNQNGVGGHKIIDHLGLLLADTHTKGLRYGPTFSLLDEKPDYEEGAIVDSDTVDTEYNEEKIEFPGEWTADMRMCLQADAPRPCTVLGVSMDFKGNR